jgi:hypothetical protein
MSRNGSIVFLFIFVFGCTQGRPPTGLIAGQPPAIEGAYIGLHHPPLPLGLDDQAGYLIDPDAKIEYAVSYIARFSGKMLWLERLTHRDSSGRPFFEVRAVLALPPISDQEFLIFGQCRVDEVIDPEIIALVETSGGALYTEIRKAWRADRRAERFEALLLDGLTCIDESAGV